MKILIRNTKDLEDHGFTMELQQWLTEQSDMVLSSKVSKDIIRFGYSYNINTGISYEIY